MIWCVTVWRDSLRLGISFVKLRWALMMYPRCSRWMSDWCMHAAVLWQPNLEAHNFRLSWNPWWVLRTWFNQECHWPVQVVIMKYQRLIWYSSDRSTAIYLIIHFWERHFKVTSISWPKSYQSYAWRRILPVRRSTLSWERWEASQKKMNLSKMDYADLSGKLRIWKACDTNYGVVQEMSLWFLFRMCSHLAIGGFLCCNKSYVGLFVVVYFQIVILFIKHSGHLQHLSFWSAWQKQEPFQGTPDRFSLIQNEMSLD